MAGRNMPVKFSKGYLVGYASRQPAYGAQSTGQANKVCSTSGLKIEHQDMGANSDLSGHTSEAPRQQSPAFSPRLEGHGSRRVPAIIGSKHDAT